MQPSFDLNLLKTNKAYTARKLFAAAEAAHILKKDAKIVSPHREKARSLTGVCLRMFRCNDIPSAYPTSR